MDPKRQEFYANLFKDDHVESVGAPKPVKKKSNKTKSISKDDQPQQTVTADDTKDQTTSLHQKDSKGTTAGPKLGKNAKHGFNK